MKLRKAMAIIALGLAAATVPSTAHASHILGGLRGNRVSVANQNSCFLCAARSGDANATNTANVNQGPRAGSIFGGSMAQQTGDNNANIGQEANAQSGDAVSGSQITNIGF